MSTEETTWFRTPGLTIWSGEGSLRVVQSQSHAVYSLNTAGAEAAANEIEKQITDLQAAQKILLSLAEEG